MDCFNIMTDHLSHCFIGAEACGGGGSTGVQPYRSLSAEAEMQTFHVRSKLHHYRRTRSKLASEPRCTNRRNACLCHYNIRFGHDLDLWSLTLKTFSAIPAHMTNKFGKFHWNPSTKYRNIASCETGVDEQRTDRH